MSEGDAQFSLRRLFLLVGIAAVTFGSVVWLGQAIDSARFAAAQSAYGKRRFTRAKAEAIAERTLDNLPDEEFREIPK